MINSLARVNIVNNTKCTCNYEFQDLNHVLWNCPLYENARLKLTQYLFKCKEYPSYSITSLLSICDPKVISPYVNSSLTAIYKYSIILRVKKCKIA